VGENRMYAGILPARPRGLRPVRDGTVAGPSLKSGHAYHAAHCVKCLAGLKLIFASAGFHRWAAGAKLRHSAHFPPAPAAIARSHSLRVTVTGFFILRPRQGGGEALSADLGRTVTIGKSAA